MRNFLRWLMAGEREKRGLKTFFLKIFFQAVEEKVAEWFEICFAPSTCFNP